MGDKVKEATEFMKERPEVDEAKILEMRDRITNKVDKWANRIQVSMAFTPKITRREGERWVDGNGKNWVMSDGIAQSISTTQDARMPIWCPSCKKPMNGTYDKKFYWLRGHCLNCNIDRDGEMIAKNDGTWEKYQHEIMTANEVAMLKDKIAEHLDYIRTFSTPQAHFDDGRWEELATRQDFSMLFEKLEADIEFCLARLEIIRQEEENVNVV